MEVYPQRLDPWMPTSRERLAMHLVHAHKAEAEVDDASKREMSIAHRTGWPACQWTSTRPNTQPKTRNWRR